MRDSKGSDNLEHVEESGSKGAHRPPPAVFALQHRRQEQRQQKQDMVVSRPNVPYAFAQEVDKLQTRSRSGELEFLRQMVRRESRDLNVSIGFDPHQAAMKGIGFKKQTIDQLQHFGTR